jgi:phosphatidylglycerol:prolipoprotein diacylglycerol transferase
MQFTLPIHLYGLILSGSMVVGWLLVGKKARQYDLPVGEIENAGIAAIVGGILGARVWHVLTDWPLYQHNLIDVLYIWQGGLSIFGAVAGGVIAVWFWLKMQRSANLTLTTVLDLSIFGLPFAQALGRWGNYVNQELYGWPTNVPWAIFIEPQHRLPGFESYSYFHPLFFYEAFLMVLFGVFVWWLDAKTKRTVFRVGRGTFFLLYVVFYSVIRLLLDLLRPDKSYLMGGWLGVNQGILLIVLVVGGYTLWRVTLQETKS